MKTPAHGLRAFGDWVALYEKKSGSAFTLTGGEELEYCRGHGFYTWTAGKDWLHILKLCGDSWFFRPIIYGMLVKFTAMGGKGLQVSTRRNAGAYLRIFGGAVYGESGDGVSYIRITLENANLDFLQRSEDR